jgi:hypothetical protein
MLLLRLLPLSGPAVIFPNWLVAVLIVDELDGGFVERNVSDAVRKTEKAVPRCSRALAGVTVGGAAGIAVASPWSGYLAARFYQIPGKEESSGARSSSSSSS